MKLVCQTKLHFREGNSDKVYEVDLCDAGGEKFVVNFRYGRRGAELKEGTKTTVPVGLAEAEKIFQKLVDEKTRKGYHVAGEKSQTKEQTKAKSASGFDEAARKAAILDALKDAKAKSNPRIERIVWRAGELKIKEAAPHVANLVGTARELRDYCIAWSLGFCGDENSLPVLEKLAAHRAEFVRRIAREATRKLGDEKLKNDLIEKAISELPQTLRNLAKNAAPEGFEKALREEISKPARGSFAVLSRVYEIDNAVTRPALLKILREIPFKPKFFKPVRQIFKAAEYRRDAEVFGIIAKRFETENHNFRQNPWGGWILIPKENGDFDPFAGIYEAVKPAELKKEDSRLAYGDKTREYFRRRTWRTLRRLGEIGDADYVKMAARALLEYSDADAREPKKTVFYDYHHTGRYDWRDPKLTEIFWDRFSPYLLFNHILYQNSPRYELKTSSRGFRTKGEYKTGDPAPNVREEAFPRLWEAQPENLLRLLAESECLPVHEFAVKALRDCREFVAKLDVQTVLMLLEKPYEITNELGFEIAKSLYDENDPNVELAVAVAVCQNAEVRSEAFRWIEARREIFAKNEAAMLKLLTAAQRDAREFGARILQTTYYSESEAKNLIALLVSEMLSFDETRSEIAAGLGDAIFRSFGKELRTLNLSVVNDLLSHRLVETQVLGGNILLNHETSAENLPNELIDALIKSPFEQIRGIGIKLFGQLPDENLLRREAVISALLAHDLADVHHAIRPTASRLAANYPGFRKNLVNAIFIALLQPEKAEGVHARLLDAVKNIPDWARLAELKTAKLLAQSEFSKASEIAGLIFEARADEWRDEFSIEEIIEFSNHEVLALRRASWRIAEQTAENLRGEVSLLVRALDAKWRDSREFWREFFRRKFTANELTPEILVAVCDSVRDETQKFGRDLLLHYFNEENGAEYLVKLSEHPSAAMQLFATNYLENHASDAPEKIEKLAPYFTRVLSQVNRSRAAKDRVLRFLEREALKDERAAQIAARILARQSATVAVGDKASMIAAMLKIRRKFPNIELPIKINQTEVRVNAV
jgi:predicted DNA-binding WGR domain protein